MIRRILLILAFLIAFAFSFGGALHWVGHFYHSQGYPARVAGADTAPMTHASNPTHQLRPSSL